MKQRNLRKAAQMPSNDDMAKALLDAKSKVRIAVVGAVCSLVGAMVSALLTYNANTQINAATQKATLKIAQLKGQIERGTLAMQRAKMVERLLGELTSGKETKAKLAFLNLWQLHPDPTERSIFILTALEKSDRSVVKTMILLKSELGTHLEKIRDAAEPTSCDVPSLRDCAFTENAKALLMHIEPGETLGLLLEQMSSYATTGSITLSDGNIRLINDIIKYHPETIDQLEEKYTSEYRDLHAISYLLYATGRKQHFRDIIANGDEKTDQFELIRGIVSAPLQEVQRQDWKHLIRIATTALESGENPLVMTDMIRLLDRARARKMLQPGHLNKLQPMLTRLATSATADASVRRRSIGLLTAISPGVGVQTMKTIVGKEAPLNRILQAQMHQILEQPQMHKWFKTSLNIQEVPVRDDDFNKWRNFLMEIKP